MFSFKHFLTAHIQVVPLRIHRFKRAALLNFHTSFCYCKIIFKNNRLLVIPSKINTNFVIVKGMTYILLQLSIPHF